MTTYMTARQVQELLGITRNTVHLMTKDGRLPKPLKLNPARNGSVRYDTAKVKEALARMESTP